MVDAIFGVTLVFMIFVWVAMPFTLSAKDKLVPVVFAIAGLVLFTFNIVWALHFGKY